jgi:superfamily II DNA or RNA helicase
MTQPAKTFLALFASRTGRKPDAQTRRFLLWLESLYRDMDVYRPHLTEHDLSRRVPGWPAPKVWSYDSVLIWPKVSMSREAFYACLHEALAKRNPKARLLELFPPAPEDLEKIAHYLAEEEAREWQKKIRSWAQESTGQSPHQPLELRIRLGLKGCSIQSRQQTDAPFTQLSQSRLRTLLGNSSPAFLNPASQIIFHLLRSFYNQNSSHMNFCPHPASADTWLLLLNEEKYRGAIIGESTEEPLTIDPEPVLWQLQEIGVNFSLTPTWRGQPLLQHQRLFFNQPDPYIITPKAILHVPSGLELLDHCEQTPLVFPRAAIQSLEALQWLRGLLGTLPTDLASRLQRIAPQAHFHFSLRYQNKEPSEVQVVLKAADKNGNILAANHYGKWQPTRENLGRGTVEEPWLELDTAALLPAREALDELKPAWSHYTQKWTLRWSSRTPQRLADWFARYREQFTIEAKGELADFLEAPLRGQLHLEVNPTKNDWFDLQASWRIEDLELTPEEIDLLLRAKGKFVHLPTKGWRRLVMDFDEKDEERLANLGLAPADLQNPRPQRVHALQLSRALEENLLPERAIASVREKIARVQTSVAALPPAGLQATLRPYQLEGFRFLAYLSTNQFGGLLADDMGLGKTVQTLAWLLWLRESAPGQPTLVLCPKSVLGVWKNEVAKFAPDLPLADVVDSSTDWKTIAASGGLILANYTQLRLRATELAAISWQALILDEAQAIKNPSSQTAQLAREISATHRLALTGTPIENRLLDLWSIYAFAMPGLLGTRAAFQRSFSDGQNRWTTTRLAARIRPFFLRRTKSQVADDLPPRIEEDLFCELDGTQSTLYQAELKKARQHLLKIKSSKQFDQSRFHLLTSLLRLRQISCHPTLAGHPTTTAPAKVQALLDQLETLLAEKNKALVFSQWTEMLALLEPLLLEQGWKVFLLTGQTEDRQALVAEFQEYSGPAIFLISLKAGGSGLNLTAASYVYLFDPWWNPAVEAQAIDRTHRIGQTSTVFAYRLLAKNTVEEKIRALQTRKQFLAEEVTGSGGFSEALTLDDFRYLLEQD